MGKGCWLRALFLFLGGNITASNIFSGPRHSAKLSVFEDHLF